MKKILLIGVPLILVGCAVWFFLSKPEPVKKKKKGPVFFEYILARKGEFPQGAYQTWYNWSMQSKRGPNLLADVISVGPDNIGGRTRAVLWDDKQPERLFVGAISGGMWKSADSGRNWAVVNDYQVNLNITHVTQSPFDPNIIYYCTGEGAGNSSAAAGAGIFKSTDGGATFSQLPASVAGPFNYTWRIRHSLVDSNTIFVATQSSGLYRSRDAGQTFERIYVTTRPVHDLEVFNDSLVMFSVQGLGIFSCIHGNTGTFVQKTTGLPVSNTFGRVELAYCGSQDNVMYAAFASAANDNLQNIYRSNDRGNTWAAVQSKPTGVGVTFPYTWYCLTMNVKYDNPEAIMIGSVEAGMSVNGGKNWTKIKNSHSDYHAIEVNPKRPGKVMVGNDGGVFEYDWSTAVNQFVSLNKGFITYQCYAGTFAATGISAMSGSQDNGTNYNNPGSQTFNKVFGADGSYCHIHQQNSREAYISWQNGHIRKTDDYQAANVFTYEILNDMDTDLDDEVDDGAWFINPFAMNYLDGEQLFFPTKKRIYRSTSGGVIWDPITNNINSGSSQEPFVVGISNQLSPAAYVGGSNGLFYRIKNAAIAEPGQEKNLRPLSPGPIRNSFIGCVKVNPIYHNVVYVGLTNYSTDPRIYRIDKADSDTPVWVDISGNLPDNLPVNWIEIDPASPDSVIFIGTDYGLYYTDDAGVNWYKDPTVPNVVVDMLQIRHSDRRLFIYTHGRGIWSGRILPDGKAIPPHDILSAKSTENLEVGVFPNPTREKVRVNWNPSNDPTLTVSVVDINGKVMKNATISSGETIDLSALPAGVYFLTDGKRFSSKILKL